MSRMDQRLHFITFATADLDHARSFYKDGLGWDPLMDVPGEIIFFQVAPGQVLGLFDARKFDQDLALGTTTTGVSGVTAEVSYDTIKVTATLQTAVGTNVTVSRMVQP